MSLRSAPLDGVRALAVVAVLLYHAHYSWAVGGYLGVDVFFVLSGYLITGVLLSTHRSFWGYRQFLVRRAVRLVPALVVAMTGVTVVSLATSMGAPTARCGAASLGYVMNLPFAEHLGCPAMWHITWSLAAEQQFYLLWPLLLATLALVLRRLRPESLAGRGHGLAVAAVVCLAAYAVEVCWQLVARVQGGVVTAELAYGPGGRCLVLLVGCSLALWRAARRAAHRPDRATGSASVVLASVAALVWCFVTGALGSDLKALVPLVVVGVASLALVSALLRSPTTSVAARVLGARPVAWLGRVSYSLYLWHEVAYRLAETVAPRGTPVAEVLRFSLALLFAAASHRWVEQPSQRWWAARRTRQEDVDERVLVPTS
ncbi:MAG: acyltransferase [Actinomycetota bacterium]|nr:acyltransferase [Actinomycetota bacterium]